MAVKLRLSRIGKKNVPFYRIIAVDGRNKRDGEYLEDLGTYNPRTGEIIQFHAEQVQMWINRGAIESDTVKRIHKMYKKARTAPATPAAKPAKAAPKKTEEAAAVAE